jgi:UDP-N-acetylglucosamine 2-epimerase (non-hydrolysing)
MINLEPLVIQEQPEWVLVYGDVNSTVAAALVCSKLNTPLAHIEAGLRSFDRTMPEEVNRMVTDRLADLFFTPSEDANSNLAQEGIPAEKIHLVGNVMIDTLIRMLPAAEEHVMPGLPSRFVLVTLHRPSNVDDLDWLQELLRNLQTISDELPVIFSVHPRTRKQIDKLNLDLRATRGLTMLDPLAYLSFLALQRRATAIITDSGGIQEEATFLGVPCLTVRENTERPVTTQLGTNVLVGRDTQRLLKELETILCGRYRKHSIPPLWDGHTAERIADILAGCQQGKEQAWGTEELSVSRATGV